ncbi:MAG: pirin family protein [Saprospiraceae bacterium]|nr:pirin family protein [Saprospiraceae bacterium]
MGDIWLDQALPIDDIEQVDPFLLIHHWKTILPGGQKQQEVGVGPHPHRGFSPVTLIFEGGLHHRDSRGNDQVIYQGGTQWMHSGMGIIHSERPAKELAEQGGSFEIIQFWVNVPSSSKMSVPSYQPLTTDQTPKVMMDETGSTISIITGKFKEMEGPIQTESPLLILRLDLNKGIELDFEIPSDYQAMLYILSGSITSNDSESLRSKDLVIFGQDGQGLEISCAENTTAILLAGQPLHEPVSSYGPFVMNDQTDIMKAIKDYQIGKMGVLIEEFS